MHTIVADQDGELHAVLEALRAALQAGDSAVRLPADWSGLVREIAALVTARPRPAPAGPGLRLRRRRRAGGGSVARLSAAQGTAILEALLSTGGGDAAARLPAGWPGLAGRVAEAFNAMAEAGERRCRDLDAARLALERQAAEIERTAQRTAQCKSELIATMSHELRTPLSSLLILSGQLARNPEGNLTERQVLFAETIHASGSELLDLIDDTLDLAKIESGTVVTDPAEVRLAEVCRYLERTFSPIAQAARLELRLGIDPRLPPAIVTDARRLQQILVNLLSNAFKFTEAGRVTLTLEPVEPAEAGADVCESGPDARESGPGGAGFIAMRVADTGIGIPPDQHERVFEAFQQVGGGIGRRYAGTGLGLAIARGLARLLGGEIGLESSPGRGSSFTLYLPVDGTQPPSPLGPARAAAPAAEAAAALSHLRAVAEPSRPTDARALMAALRAWLQGEGR